MTQEQFNQHVEDRIALIKATLSSKAEEYVRDSNPFHNFEKGASITGESPAKVLDGFLLKHYISYRDILNDIEQGKPVSEALIKEKFGDIINYFILQEALLLDLMKKQVQKELKQFLDL